MRYPVNYIAITRGFTSSHLGVDFGWNSNNGGPYHDIVAIDDGTVTAVVDGYGNTYPANRIYGNYVLIDHGWGLSSLYAHILNGSIKVKRGQRVTAGEVICRMNNSGYSAGTHLHFELRKNGTKIDPLPCLTANSEQKISPNSALTDRIKRGEILTIKPETADRMRDQIKVNINGLRIRSNPYLDDTNIIGTLRRGIYNVCEIRDMRHEASNKYLWYRIAENAWCANVNGVDFYKAELPEIIPLSVEDKAEKLEQTVDEMKKDLLAILEIIKKYV
ncbi:MAG: M23 family metallopeptidase [Ruminococcaceae bacterium]|nr:M23 family metallopeptidase [Oscillospiraceae bacterium]